jgi:hypothetical protein
MAETYTIRQLAAATGLARTQLEQWITRGHFRPQNAEPETKARAFTLTDAICLSALAELVRLGHTAAAASPHVHHLHGFKDDAALLVVMQGPMEIKLASGKTIVAYDPDEPGLQSKIIRLRDIGKLATDDAARSVSFVNLDNIEKRVKSALAKQVE